MSDESPKDEPSKTNLLWKWSKELWIWLCSHFAIFIRRGYIGVAVGIFLVKSMLDHVLGTIPQMPGKLTDGAIFITIMVALFMYRQTLSSIRLRAFRQRDLRRGASLSIAAMRAAPSADTREAIETHWRAQRAMTWMVITGIGLGVYLFAYKVTIREANLTVGGVQVQEPVVFPPSFMRPGPVKDHIYEYAHVQQSDEPIDDVLSYKGVYYAKTFPNQFPEYIYAIVIPLNVLFALFCVTLTRSLAFAFAPSIRVFDDPPPPDQQVESKPGMAVTPKGIPSGADMGVEILDAIDDITSFL